MKHGGNAVDAAVATGFALAVTIPRRATSAAADSWSSAWPTDAPRRSTIARSRRSPRRATCTSTNGKLTDKSMIGHLASGVPGAVAGLAEALREVRHDVARRRDGAGDPLAERRLRRSTARYGALVRRQRAAHRAVRGRGALPARAASRSRAGTRLVQPDLARTLRAIARAGRDGILRRRDRRLARRRRAARRRDHHEGGSRALSSRCGATPIRSTYRGYTLLTMPPSSSGGITMTETLNILESFAPLPPSGSARIRASARLERYQRAFIDRNEKLGDPAFVNVPLEQLTDKAYARNARARRSARSRRRRRRLFSGARARGRTRRTTPSSTRSGNAVATTTTLNGGCTARACGFAAAASS